ncbi:MAG TPA: DUF5004 domain-containing protein [Puia sp.]|jgi:hypothetical protein
MKKLLVFFAAVCFAGFFACKPERLVVPYEPVKELSGSWSVVRATRNGTDITSRFDFSHFRINFSDSSYTIDSLVPFIVSKNGKWAFDDPLYPFNINFTPTDSAKKASPLLFPVVNGKRSVIVTFSPGCDLNSYQYTLQKAN